MMARRKLTVLLSGMMAGDPHQGGATWAVLQYLLGLRRLGHEVVFVEPVKPGAIRPDGESLAGSINAVVRSAAWPHVRKRRARTAALLAVGALVFIAAALARAHLRPAPERRPAAVQRAREVTAPRAQTAAETPVHVHLQRVVIAIPA